MTQKIDEYEVVDPKQLVSCCEFTVDSQSFDPSFAGPISIRLEPKRMGVRWLGQKEWVYIEWHELMVFADNPSQIFRQIISDMKEEAREKGFNEGLQESAKPAQEQEKPKVTRFIYEPKRA